MSSGLRRRYEEWRIPTHLWRRAASGTYAENLRLRELLTLVAHDLERIACQERYTAHTGPLSERGIRIRRYLHEGLKG